KEKELMHAGVARDEKRREKKLKFEKNQQELEQQIKLKQEYEQIQPVLENEKNKEDI
ncbi:2441_t:CDS:2, partial [Acaulospora morrowiae]